MNTGSEIINKVISIAYGGEGIIKEKDLTGFVPGAIPGELVKSKITDIKNNYFRSKLIEIIEKSPSRTIPPCPYFNMCGGCIYQHINYSHHCEIKIKQLKDLLSHLGKIQYEKEIKFIPSPKMYAYRNQLSVKTKTIKEKLEIGFIGFDNKTFIPIEKCLIANENINIAIKKIKQELAKSVKIKKINKDMIIKTGGDSAIDFAFSESMSQNGDYKLLEEKIDNKTYYFSLSTFFQTNPYIIPALLSELKDILQPTTEETLFDLYCGTGLFSIYFSSFVKNAYGIELNPGAIKLAKKTAEKNNIKNCRFIEGNADESFTKLFNQNKSNQNILILDPPRAGLSMEMLNQLKEIKTNKLVYISCEPSKLARDLSALCSSGYKIINIFVADMFPQTKHMESIAILTR
jgi:tRNA/tmRNA/rRNA uracil-C5-methylase (TrmA/RlmC/RlmD family)